MRIAVLRRALAAAAFTCCSSASFSATPAASLDAGDLAAAALGDLPGVAAVGILRGEAMEVAVRRRDRAGGPAISLAPAPGEEPVFEVGSVSKVFTGLLVARAVDRGELQLDDPLGKLLEGRVRFQWEHAPRLTVRQLLTHTACLPRWPATGSRDPVARQLAQYDRPRLWSDLGRLLISRTPPCESRYSNYGYAVLGQLLAERSRTTWEALVREHITAPARMSTTAVATPGVEARLAPSFSGTGRAGPWRMDAFAPAGGLRSTATDLLLFSRALLAGRAGPFGAAAERAVTDLAGYGEKSDRIGYGVILPAGAPSRAWVHGGLTEGFRAEWVAWPEHGEALVILASNSQAQTRELARQAVRQTQPAPAPAQQVVYTSGELRSTSTQQGRRYAHIKLAPGQQIPFSTLTFRVLDARVLADVPTGALVEFRAQRVDGENVLVEIRPVRP